MDLQLRKTLTLTLILSILLFTPSLCNLKGGVRLFDRQTANLIFKQHKPAIMLLLHNQDEKSQTFKAISQLSAQFQGVIFTYSKKSQDVYTKLTELVGTNNLNDTHVIYFTDVAEKFLLELSPDQDLTAEKVKSFMKLADVHQIEEFLRSNESSQALPDDELGEYKKYIKYYNSYQFRNAIRGTDKQFLVVLYAQWCPHSRKLSPVILQIAKKLSSDENVIVAKMDASVNQIRGFEPTGYPTILWYSRNKYKQPTFYYGDRSLQHILSWIQTTRQTISQAAVAEQTAATSIPIISAQQSQEL